MLVVDANIAFKWLWPEKDSASAAKLLDGRLLAAPEFIMTELTNIFWLKVNAKAIKIEDAQDRLREFRAGPVKLLPDYTILDRAFEIAAEIQHSIYDCMYLSLLDSVGAILVTDDGGIIRDCKRVARFKNRVLKIDDYLQL
jgi:predicted nucleic acid-binding protein